MNLVNEFTTAGQLSRRTFWLRHLIAVPIGLFICISMATVMGPSWDVLPAGVLTLFLISTWGRRLHDRGLTAWLLLIVLVPVIGPLYLIWQCACRKGAVTHSAAGVVGYTTVQSGA